MRILGIDPGSLATGYGVVEEQAGSVKRIECGTVRPPRGTPFHKRLSDIHEALSVILQRLAPDEVAVENPFYHKNVHSLLQLGQARAAALLPAIRAGIPVFEYAPREIKQAVAGHGNAEKRQVARMVAMLLRESEPLSSLDSSDALAVAICHAHRSHGARRYLKTLA